MRDLATDFHSQRPVKKAVFPSWIGSIGLHAVLLVVLLTVLNFAPARLQAPGDRTADVGIVLRHEQESGEATYESQNDQADGQVFSTGSSAATLSQRPTINDLVTNTPSIDTTSMLPATDPVIGGGRPEPGDNGGASAGSAMSGLGSQGNLAGGKAKVTFFNIEGEGSRFVFVIDRSESMGDSGEAALRLAKQELKAAIDSLEPTHQFEIVFFNEQPSVFNPAGDGRTPFATEQNITLAKRFIDSITPSGGTRHESALMLALQRRADVIFFLTDAGTPMSDAELRKIRSEATPTINAIEFGFGPPGRYNFLHRLASENNGQYYYVDIAKYSAAQ